MIRTENVQASQCFLCPYGSRELETSQRGRPGQSALLVAEAQAAHGFRGFRLRGYVWTC